MNEKMSLRNIKIGHIIWRFFPLDSIVKNELKREKLINAQEDAIDGEHLKKTAMWLCRAHDATKDRGVSRSYKAARFKGYGRYGWQPAYPETTGYIISTIIALSNFLKNTNYAERAIRMADWEIDIQLPSGAVMGSVVTAKPSPAVFNTGQVIFGWLAAFKESKNEKYLNAAAMAANYLVSIQDEDGTWSKG
ncbi:hypothetical protein KAU19_08165, partial [Candidatus Parcubacteria bacterium]|nr:hypothetical protein [Candidatus Parcubacteria bacterium]